MTGSSCRRGGRAWREGVQRQEWCPDTCKGRKVLLCFICSNTLDNKLLSFSIFQCNIIRGGPTLVVLVKFPPEIALSPPPLLRILFSRKWSRFLLMRCWSVVVKFEKLAWLSSYFVQVGPRQIKWVSCHENTPNNVINHELLRSQFLQTYNFPHLDISAATSQTSRKNTLWRYVYIRLKRQVSGLNHSKWLSISRLELHLVYWWHFPDRLKTELCQ